jgi:hypothetical protein
MPCPCVERSGGSHQRPQPGLYSALAVDARPRITSRPSKPRAAGDVSRAREVLKLITIVYSVFKEICPPISQIAQIQVQDFRFEISNLKFQISDLKSQIRDICASVNLLF